MASGLAPETPAAVIAAATTQAQRVLVATVADIAEKAQAQQFEPPAIVVIGDIVTLREQLLGAFVSASEP
jgi:uroporphyrin-III C-methyltransferase